MSALELGMLVPACTRPRRTHCGVSAQASSLQLCERPRKREQTSEYTATDNDSIWLADFANKTLNSSSIYLHGFDVSPNQFPPGNEIAGPGDRKIPLTVHDACQRYPAEHRGRYDLVHIRLLTAGLKQDGYSAVLRNARDLLSTSKSQHDLHPICTI